MNRKLTMLMLAIGISLSVPGVVQAQPCTASLPNGLWDVNANGHQGNLLISVNAAGNVAGTITLIGAGVDAIRGFWTASACKLTFLRVDGNTFNPANALSIQSYTGYFYPLLAPSPTTSQKRMAGYFESTSQSGGSASRYVYGWHASR